ncbi:MAG: FKBP-type peptidyl-prolyl cis-trans isomerase [Prevotella sp.]|nr:FKBP-type peptidyl-prolyl cis-trans isomerase [Prevotella sp.]
MEEQNKNLYIAVAYKLFAAGEKTLQFIEEATDERPFVFISGFGVTLPEFEKQVAGLSKGQEFNFTLAKEQAYGDIEAERIVDLSRDIFCIDGKFDSEHVQVGAILPMQNEDGQYFHGRVVAIDDQQVRIDLNHPLAGRELNFNGYIVESREATNEEIQQFINRLSGGGCGEGCGGCGGCGSDDGGCGGGGCGNCNG